MHILTLTAFHSLPPSLPPTCVQWYQTSCKTLGHCPQAVCGKEPGLAGGCFDLAWAVDMLKRFETVGACSKDGAQTGKDSWATCDPTTCKTFPLEKITVGGGLYYKSVWGQPDGQLTAQNVFDMDTAVGNRLQGAGAWSINYGLVGGVNEPGSLPSDPSFFPDLGTKWGITGRRRLTMQASKMQSHGAGFGAAVMAKVSAVVDAVVTTFASPASSSFSAPSSSSTSRLLAECDAKPDTTTTCAATAACPTDPSAAGGGTGTGTGGAAADGATTYAWCVGPPTSATACPAYSPATCPTACGKGSSTRTRTVQCMETTRPKGVAATPTTAPDAKCTASSKPPVSSACAATAACSGGGGSTGGSTGGTARCGKDYGDANGRCGTSCPSKTNAECTTAGETCYASLKACSATGPSSGGGAPPATSGNLVPTAATCAGEAAFQGVGDPLDISTVKSDAAVKAAQEPQPVVPVSAASLPSAPMVTYAGGSDWPSGFTFDSCERMGHYDFVLIGFNDRWEKTKTTDCKAPDTGSVGYPYLNTAACQGGVADPNTANCLLNVCGATVGEQILKAQKKGQKILLSVGGANSVDVKTMTPQKGIDLARAVWEVYMGGTDPAYAKYRPFGAKVRVCVCVCVCDR